MPRVRAFDVARLSALASAVLWLASMGAALAQKKPLSDGNQPPLFEIPPYQQVAPGREISFGLHAIDPEGDPIAIELVARPQGASYDPITLTVRWKPTAKDAPAGRFRARITETPRGGTGKRAYVHDFSIAIDPKASLPAPQPLGDAAELMITIRDPQRLEQVNKDWPLVKMLEVVRRVELARLPEAERKAADGRDGAALYKDALGTIALRHNNPRANPDAPEFDRKAFGDPATWKITAVRPRVDKNAQELRVVYQALAAPEPVYLMFRFRLVKDTPDMPPEAMALNNGEFTRLVHEAFFVGPDLNPKLVADKAAHGKAVSALVGKILNYTSDKHPLLGTEFMALPHEARLGGGSARGADGKTYASGDGWAWAVLKAKWDERKKLRIVSVPIPGFTSDIRPSADGSKWTTVCAPKFDPDDPARVKGWEVLCRKKLGFTDLPMPTPQGGVAPSPIDATNLFVEFKNGDLVARVDLRDPRRDLFEENGMTCSQCHVRDFANGDRRDPATRDPKAPRPPAASPRIAITFFNIIPEQTWRPFTVAFQHFQECQFKDAFAKHLKVQTNLVCPLVAE